MAIEAEADAETIVTELDVAETAMDAEAAACVVSGSPYRPLAYSPEPYVERKAISWP
tara:strand:- start:998 stop:1168 length:171 start_codon:yes stop_codon:yes gene_type:complete